MSRPSTGLFAASPYSKSSPIRTPGQRPRNLLALPVDSANLRLNTPGSGSLDNRCPNISVHTSAPSRQKKRPMTEPAPANQVVQQAAMAVAERLVPEYGQRLKTDVLAAL